LEGFADGCEAVFGEGPVEPFDPVVQANPDP
jgi:hypothetical protein